MQGLRRRALLSTKLKTNSLLKHIAALMLTLFIVGCGSSGEDFNYTDIDNITPTVQHQITVVFDEPQNQAFLPIAESLEESGFYQRLAEEVSNAYILPKDITFRFTELNSVNAHYDPEKNEIAIAYELVEAYAQLFDFDPDDPDAALSEYIDASLYTALHELGHCFVDLFGLPIVGREEDAVDEFATLLLAEIGDANGFNALIAGMQQFYSDAESGGGVLSESAFADEHSLDKQRFYATLLLAYGSNPTKYHHLIASVSITPEQAAYAPEEYKRKKRTWERLLGPFER